MAQSERLTKLDVVQRQLRTTIRMFFADGDTVSAYTLAAAAEGVLAGLLKKQGKTHPFRATDIIKKGMEKEFNRILNKPQKFFKHADVDADDVLDFPEIALEYVLFQCTILYQLYRGKHLRESWLFLIWFGIHHPNLVEDGSKAFLVGLKQQAPTLATGKGTYLEILSRPDLYPAPYLE